MLSTHDTSGLAMRDLSADFPLFVDDEFDLVRSCLDVVGKELLEIGCGKGDTTRRLATDGRARHVVGIEVDEVQLGRNLKQPAPPNVEFRRCGAEALSFDAASFDAVLMFKSLHHVPTELMGQAFSEIHRVLRPEGRLYISEPVYAGPYNDIMRIFHDEGTVREAAIRAIDGALGEGLFRRERQVRFFASLYFKNFEAFRNRLLNVTHTQHVLTPAVLSQIEATYEANQSPTGARFLQPMRLDLLVKA